MLNALQKWAKELDINEPTLSIDLTKKDYNNLMQALLIYLDAEDGFETKHKEVLELTTRLQCYTF